MSRLTDTEFQAQIRDSEYFNDFLTRRDELAHTGMKKTDAYEQAREEFLPLITGDAKPDAHPELSCDLPPSTDLREDMLWVYNNLEGQPDMDSCPSRGAWSFYKHVQNSNQLKAKFLETYLPKILPSKAELERMTRKQDDGSELVELGEFVAKAYVESLQVQEEALATTGPVTWGQTDD